MRYHLPMKLCSAWFILAISSSVILAAELPKGQDTPEGAACDAITSHMGLDPKAWLATLVRPIYGPDGNKQYAQFKDDMLADIKAMKEDNSFKPPKIVKVFKARYFSKNGPGSAAYAFYDFQGNQFVDIIIETDDDKTQRLRYHVLLDKDKKWYFDPRPDLSPLLSTDLDDETESTEVLYEAK